VSGPVVRGGECSRRGREAGGCERCACGCVVEYGGGEGGERRNLDDNFLTGPLPAEIGNMVALTRLCVRPASPWSATHPREAHWMGEQGGVMRRVFT
jgi:hypothetical protein